LKHKKPPFWQNSQKGGFSMTENNEIYEDLKHIECASDNLLERVTDVLERYSPNGEYQIIASEDNDFIHDNIRVYSAFSEDETAPSISIVVQEGLDHYVAKVIDAFELH
jgi:hypothetical protein